MFANPQEVSEYAKDCLDIIETKSFYVESIDKEIDYVYKLYDLALQNDIRAVAIFKSKALDLINKNNSITKQQQEIYDLMLNSNHRIEKLTDKINQAKDYLFNYVNDERLANRIETLEYVLSLMKMKHSELEEENEKLIGQIDRIVELEDKYLKLFNEKFSDVSIGTAIKEVQEKTSETKISFNIGFVLLIISIVLWVVGVYLSINTTPVDVSVLSIPNSTSNMTKDGTITGMFQPIINSLKYVMMLFSISLMIMVVYDIKNAAEGKGEIITIIPKIVVGLIISLISASFTFPPQNENQYSELINNFKTEPTKINLDALNQEMKLSDKTYNYLLAATNKEDAAKYVVSFRKDMSILPDNYDISYIRHLEKQYDNKLIATPKNFSWLKVAALILAIVSGVMMIIAHKEKKYFSEFK